MWLSAHVPPTWSGKYNVYLTYMYRVSIVYLTCIYRVYFETNRRTTAE